MKSNALRYFFITFCQFYIFSCSNFMCFSIKYFYLALFLFQFVFILVLKHILFQLVTDSMFLFFV